MKRQNICQHWNHRERLCFYRCKSSFRKTYKGEKVNTTDDMAKIMLEDYKVAVVPCGDFGFDDHIRLSYAISEEQIVKGMNRIKEFVKELS